MSGISKTICLKNELPKPNDPLHINTVMDCVFSFLSIKDVKICRLVNPQWNFVAENVLRKRSAISFGYSSGKLFSPIDFMDVFATSSINMSSFCFSDDVDWSISILNNFFEQHRERIQEVKLDNIKLIQENGVRIKNFDTTFWLSNLPLRKLEVTCSADNCTKLMVSLDQLTSAEDISFDECWININKGGNRIALIDLTFQCLEFYQDGIKLAEYLINESIDFLKVKNVVIYCQEGNTQVIFDISESFDAEFIQLGTVKVINWSNSKSAVTFLSLEGDIEFCDKTEMKIKEFSFEGSSIDLSALPKGIERISCLSVRESLNILRTQPIHFPSLTYLELSFSKGSDLVPLSHFHNCPELVDLYISQAPNSFNVECIPLSVRRMKISNKNRELNDDLETFDDDLEMHGDGGGRILDTLVIEWFGLLAAGQILRCIATKVLFLRWEMREDPETLASILVLLVQFEIETLYVGPFKSSAAFEASYLAEYVNEPGEYYVFENKNTRSTKDLNHCKGRAIEYKEFNDLCGHIMFHED